MKRTSISTKKAPAAIGPYVQAVRAGNMLYTSGQLGIDPTTGELGQGVEGQTRLSMQNLGAILKKAGADYGNIVKTTIFLQDMGDFALVNEIYASYFQGEAPARSTVQVAGLPKGGLVEIEAVAVLDA